MTEKIDESLEKVLAISREMATPSPAFMSLPSGEWNVFVNGVQLAKYTGPESLVFTVTFIPPLTEAEKAENAK